MEQVCLLAGTEQGFEEMSFRLENPAIPHFAGGVSGDDIHVPR
jgi:hypothetical protein